MRDWARLRERMLRDHIVARGVSDQRVLAAMAEIPRHLFVPENMRSQAYSDHALPIGDGQTISQPYVVARMTELLAVEAEHSVLEIGTGSGYQTAILARLARRVYSLERVGELARTALGRMRRLGLDNVKIQIFDGSVGWSEVAPFDRVMITAGAPRVPPPLLEQLAAGGRLLVPEGDRGLQRLVLYEKGRHGKLRRHQGEGVAFVPLVGRHGWDADGKE